MEREADRTSWFGEDLDKKKTDASKKSAEKSLVGAGVGMYLAGGPGGKTKRAQEAEVREPEKKKRKGGGFGDFSSW